jgi:uncharacterized metal-binding protein YceD (DUF177 family)
VEFLELIFLFYFRSCIFAAFEKSTHLKALKPFNIAFVGLSNGEHEFTFELNDEFFACFEGSAIEKAQLKGELLLDKKSNMLDLHFSISGLVWVECDRCLEPFWYQIETQQTLFVKFGDHSEEQSDDVVIIPSTDSHFEVSQYFYEYAMLALPFRIVHDENPSGAQQCDPEILQQLEKYKPKDNPEPGDDDDSDDPRWDALRNIKFN